MINSAKPCLVVPSVKTLQQMAADTNSGAGTITFVEAGGPVSLDLPVERGLGGFFREFGAETPEQARQLQLREEIWDIAFGRDVFPHGIPALKDDAVIGSIEWFLGDSTDVRPAPKVRRPQLTLKEIQGGQFKMRQPIGALRKSDRVSEGRHDFDPVQLSALTVVAVMGEVPNWFLGTAILLSVESDPIDPASTEARKLSDDLGEALQASEDAGARSDAQIKRITDLAVAASSIGRKDLIYPAKGDFIEVEASVFLGAIGKRID